MSTPRAQRKLAEQLRDLARSTATTNAFVFDAWGLIWCAASWTAHEERDCLYGQVKDILEGLEPPLQRGGKLERLVQHEAYPMYCTSFSSVYVLGLWTTPQTNLFALRRLVREAMPTIEALTSSLPPPGGPGSAAGARRGRA